LEVSHHGGASGSRDEYDQKRRCHLGSCFACGYV
jgi:hypothetical protein